MDENGPFIGDLPIKDGDFPSFFVCFTRPGNQPLQNSQIPKFQATQGLPGALPGAVPAPRYSYNAPGAMVAPQKRFRDGTQAGRPMDRTEGEDVDFYIFLLDYNDI